MFHSACVGVEAFLALCCGDAKHWQWHTWDQSMTATHTEHAFTGIAAILLDCLLHICCMFMLTFRLCAVSGFGLDVRLN